MPQARREEEIMIRRATPLTDGEERDFRALFAHRVEKVKAKTADVFSFRKVDAPPFIVNSAFYHLFGLEAGTIPPDYFENPAAMTVFQERLFYEQVRSVDDDFVPCLVPWFGTIVLASAFGCRESFPPGLDPAVDPLYYPIQSPEDIRKLRLPDPGKDGLMPRVLFFQRFMREHSFLPVGITDCQGPLTTANQLMGYDKMIYLMVDHPDLMHRLMDIITEALILWVKKQKEVTGEPGRRSLLQRETIARSWGPHSWATIRPYSYSRA
jgi:hypothetical protein